MEDKIINKVQVLKCKCGSLYAACAIPYCYTEKEWLKDMRKNVLKGGTVEMIDSDKFRFEKCKCESRLTTKNKTLSLF